MTPLGRIGIPEEIAAAAYFLASAESSDVTGIDLPVDAGLAQVGTLASSPIVSSGKTPTRPLTSA